MANRAITKKISALPTYALNNNNGNLLYSEGGANYQFPLNNIALLSNLGSSDGAKLVGGLGYVTPEMFGFVPGSTADAVPYIQAAIDEARIKNVPVYLTGTYYAKTSPITITLPGDDGTAYPAWVADGTDANISAENSSTINAALRLYSNTKIIGSGASQCVIVGMWDAENPVINNAQQVGIYIQATNPIDGYVRYQLTGVTLSGFFIGRYCPNIINQSFEDDLIMRDCCFPGILLGGDAVKNGFVTARGCWAAEVYGGWWTNRNAAITTPYLPPISGK